MARATSGDRRACRTGFPRSSCIWFVSLSSGWSSSSRGSTRVPSSSTVVVVLTAVVVLAAVVAAQRPPVRAGAVVVVGHAVLLASPRLRAGAARVVCVLGLVTRVSAHVFGPGLDRRREQWSRRRVVGCGLVPTVVVCGRDRLAVGRRTSPSAHCPRARRLRPSSTKAASPITSLFMQSSFGHRPRLADACPSGGLPGSEKPWLSLGIAGRRGSRIPAADAPQSGHRVGLGPGDEQHGAVALARQRVDEQLQAEGERERLVRLVAAERDELLLATRSPR